jgi:hypothetical protein
LFYLAQNRIKVACQSRQKAPPFESVDASGCSLL